MSEEERDNNFRIWEHEPTYGNELVTLTVICDSDTWYGYDLHASDPLQ